MVAPIVAAIGAGARAAGTAVVNGGRVAGQAAARIASRGGQALARAGAKGMQGAARAGAKARGFLKRPGSGGGGGGRAPTGSKGKGQGPGQGQGAKEKPKQPLSEKGRGLAELKAKLSPSMKARLKRQAKIRGARKGVELLKGDDSKKKQDPSILRGDGITKAAGRAAKKTPGQALKFAKKRIRRLFISKHGDKLLDKTKRPRKWAKRLILLSAFSTFAIMVSPFILVAMIFGGLPDPGALQQMSAATVATSGGPIPEVLMGSVAEATDIPIEALRAYSAAAGGQWPVDWKILAGVGKTECDHGRSTADYCQAFPGVWNTGECSGDVCGSGERGPMQHLGDLWRKGIPGSKDQQKNTADVSGPPTPPGKEEGATYIATDADGDGKADPWNWYDAVGGAARKMSLYRAQLKVKGPAYDTDEFMIAAYNAGVGGATENGPDPKSIKNQDYINSVNSEVGRIESSTTNMDIPATGAGCTATGAGPIGSTAPMSDDKSTKTMMSVANSAIACFGQGAGVGCYHPRDGTFEHPRGRACDFMRSPGGTYPDTTEKANGTALANWAVANAKSLNILYVIWYGKIWSVSKDGKPKDWSEWRAYTSATDVTGGHFDHVHISVKLMPGDPRRAHCGAQSCTE